MCEIIQLEWIILKYSLSEKCEVCVLQQKSTICSICILIISYSQ